MPVYHFTFHAYRSWRPDHPKGYVRQDEGILPADPEMAAQYDRNATQAPVQFNHELQRVLIDASRDICDRREWRLYAIACELNHAHLIVSWDEDASIIWKDVHDTLKRLLGLQLSQHTSQTGRKWFVRKGSRKRVSDRDHLDHLINVYFPKHGGLRWIQGRDDAAKR